MNENFGEILGRRVHAKHHAVLLARTLRHSASTVTEIRGDHATHERTDSLPPEDAFIVAVQLRPFPVHELWEDGRRAPIEGLDAGDVTVYDLKRDPRFRINNPFHSIHFHLSRALLDNIADEAGAKRIRDLDVTSSRGVDDPVIKHLALALRSLFGQPEEACRLFVDHITLAVAAHTAIKYGHMQERVTCKNGGLSPWQLKRALALIDSRLDAKIGITDLAAACGLSGSYFVQAFRKGTGATPHQWLLRRRVERAQEMLRDADVPTADIALACGFANQSHFTRVFRNMTRCPPSDWRRRHRVSSTPRAGR